MRERPKVKFICGVRNGKDVLASFYPFFGMHNETFRKWWGGAPPPFKEFSEASAMVAQRPLELPPEQRRAVTGRRTDGREGAQAGGHARTC